MGNNSMLAEGRGEGKVVFIRYLCYNGELGGGGLGINLLHFGEEGGGPFDHDHQHIPHTPLAVLKRRIQFLLITEWRSNGVTSLAMGIWGWVARVCFIFSIILPGVSICRPINQSVWAALFLFSSSIFLVTIYLFLLLLLLLLLLTIISYGCVSALFFLWASLILFSYSNIHPFVMVACREEEGQFFNTSNILSLLYMIACQLVMYICMSFLCGLVFYHSICFIVISLSRVLVLGLVF